MAKYLRRYELVIGETYSISKDEILQGPTVPAESKLKEIEEGLSKDPQQNSGLLLTEHRIEFNIEKTKSGYSPNTAKITIYNASDKTVDFLENKVGKKSLVLLKAAYQGEELKTIFMGNLEKFLDNFDKETRRTELTLADGGANFQETTTARYYPVGTPVDQIVSDLISDTFLPKGGSHVYKTGEAIAKPWYFSGSVIAEVNKLAAYYDYNFSVQDGACFWTPAGKAWKRDVVKISPETGLIGEVSPIDATEGTSQNNKTNTNPGIKFTSLLNGSLLPETTVFVESRTKEGAFKISKVVHKGDYEGNDWYTEVEAEQVELLAGGG